MISEAVDTKVSLAAGRLPHELFLAASANEALTFPAGLRFMCDSTAVNGCHAALFRPRVRGCPQRPKDPPYR